jgi:hypothetical protein
LVDEVMNIAQAILHARNFSGARTLQLFKVMHITFTDGLAAGMLQCISRAKFVLQRFCPTTNLPKTHSACASSTEALASMLLPPLRAAEVKATLAGKLTDQ